jgi:hypothetical protein
MAWLYNGGHCTRRVGVGGGVVIALPAKDEWQEHISDKCAGKP